MLQKGQHAFRKLQIQRVCRFHKLSKKILLIPLYNNRHLSPKNNAQIRKLQNSFLKQKKAFIYLSDVSFEREDYDASDKNNIHPSGILCSKKHRLQRGLSYTDPVSITTYMQLPTQLRNTHKTLGNYQSHPESVLCPCATTAGSSFFITWKTLNKWQVRVTAPQE